MSSRYSHAPTTNASLRSGNLGIGIGTPTCEPWLLDELHTGSARNAERTAGSSDQEEQEQATDQQDEQAEEPSSMRWDTCASPSEPGSYGIKDTVTGRIVDLRETMGVAQSAANSMNGVGPYNEVHEWAKNL
jgi:hypothetical protein